MSKKAKSHWIAVKVTFTKPVTRGMARKITSDCFKGSDQYPSEYDESIPGQMWLRAFSTSMSKGQPQ